MRTLDRYVLKTFLSALSLCFFAFLAIFLIFDLNDNGQDFIAAGLPMGRIGIFYMMQLPYLAMVTLPVGMLLALLYTITRLSRSNEVLAMLTAGISIPRIILPLMFVGLCGTGILMWLNYKMAPEADGNKNRALDEVVRGKEREDATQAHLFRDRNGHRTWFVDELPGNLATLRGVQVMQQDEHDEILRETYARTATYDDMTKSWDLADGKVVEFGPEGEVASTEYFSRKKIQDWPETPWRIASSTMRAKAMSVPDLERYLVENRDFPPSMIAAFKTNALHRWALPWTCTLVILVGAPLALTFSRRGILGSVAAALILFFLMIFLNDLFLSLGEGNRINPWIAAWTPTAVFFIIGVYLLWLRSTNREGLLPFAS